MKNKNHQHEQLEINKMSNQVKDVESHISNTEQAILKLQEEHKIPTEWLDGGIDPEKHRFKSDDAKQAYNNIVRYEHEIQIYLSKIGISRDSLQTITKQICSGEADEEGAKMSIFEGNLKLVVNLAKKYRDQAPGVEFLDLIQEGNIGLMKAIDNFDYQQGYQFRTYATWWIRQSLSRAIANQG